jgi:hypothetical protein
VIKGKGGQTIKQAEIDLSDSNTVSFCQPSQKVSEIFPLLTDKLPNDLIKVSFQGDFN